MTLLTLSLLLACGPVIEDVDHTGAAAPVSEDDTADTEADTAAGAAEAEPCEGVVPEVTELTIDELVSMMAEKDFALVNVHIPYAGEIVGTDEHVAYNDVDAIESYLGGEIDTKAVLYCLTGPMSAQAAAELVARGYCQIYDLPQGLSGWASAGHETEGY